MTKLVGMEQKVRELKGEIKLHLAVPVEKRDEEWHEDYVDMSIFRDELIDSIEIEYANQDAREEFNQIVAVIVEEHGSCDECGTTFQIGCWSCEEKYQKEVVGMRKPYWVTKENDGSYMIITNAFDENAGNYYETVKSGFTSEVKAQLEADELNKPFEYTV